MNMSVSSSVVKKMEEDVCLQHLSPNFTIFQGIVQNLVKVISRRVKVNMHLVLEKITMLKATWSNSLANLMNAFKRWFCLVCA